MKTSGLALVVLHALVVLASPLTAHAERVQEVLTPEEVIFSAKKGDTVAGTLKFTGFKDISSMSSRGANLLNETLSSEAARVRSEMEILSETRMKYKKRMSSRVNNLLLRQRVQEASLGIEAINSRLDVLGDNLRTLSRLQSRVTSGQKLNPVDAQFLRDYDFVDARVIANRSERNVIARRLNDVRAVPEVSVSYVKVPPTTLKRFLRKLRFTSIAGGLITAVGGAAYFAITTLEGDAEVKLKQKIDDAVILYKLEHGVIE